ncbi:hypothetical protein NQZ79_g1722 [Umbelopsis isabellina]|nr:hypothetical protein NQZ79_g1722 [Umbelopsis isabellina]
MIQLWYDYAVQEHNQTIDSTENAYHINRLTPTNRIDMADAVSEAVTKVTAAIQKARLEFVEESIAIIHMEYEKEAALARKTSLSDIRSARLGR